MSICSSQHIKNICYYCHIDFYVYIHILHDVLLGESKICKKNCWVNSYWRQQWGNESHNSDGNCELKCTKVGHWRRPARTGDISDSSVRLARRRNRGRDKGREWALDSRCRTRQGRCLPHEPILDRYRVPSLKPNRIFMCIKPKMMMRT